MSYRTFPPFLTEGKSRDSSPQLPMARAHPFGSAPKITLRALNNFLPAGCSGPSGTHRQEFHRLAWNLPLCFAKSFELLLSFAVPEEQGEICGRTGLCVCGASHSQNSVWMWQGRDARNTWNAWEQHQPRKYLTEEFRHWPKGEKKLRVVEGREINNLRD